MTTIFAERFETIGNGTRYTTSTPEFSDGSGDFFTRTDGSNIGSFYNVSNPEANFYFAAQDLDGEGAGSSQTLTFEDIDISGFEGLSLSLLAAEDESGDGNEDWDISDFVHIDYSIDGGAFQNLIHFESVPVAGSSFNGEPALDTDFDGTGDGTVLTDSFQPFSADIVGIGSVLDLRITFDLNAGDEDIAIDDIVINGIGSSVPTLAISATDAEKSEGDAGTTDFTFTVTRTGDASGTSSVDYAVTSDDADAADFDGAFAAGTVSFDADQTTQTIAIAVSGDTVAEPDEAFAVSLSNATGAAIATGDATGTILNDDGVFLTKIYDVQGRGNATALSGETVTIEGIVTGDFQEGDSGDAPDTSDLDGFFLQQEVGDGDAATSDGIFVFDRIGLNGFLTDVKVGDRVQVTGVVQERFDQTQISATEVTVTGSGSVEATVIDLPIAPYMPPEGGEPVAGLERFEGMLVTFADDLTVDEYFNYDRFGEIRVTEGDRPFQFTQTNAPSQEGFAAWQEELASRSIIIDDGRSIQNPTPLPYPAPGFSDTNAFRGGDLVTEVVGNLNFAFGEYRVQPTLAPVFESANPRPLVPEDVSGPGRTEDDILKVSSFNVLNFFTTLDVSSAQTAIGADPRGADNLLEFERQREKLITTILEIDADILGLVEIENDFVPGSPGNAIEDLVGGLNDELGETIYDWVNPGQQFVDASDAISVGMIYKIGSVQIAEGTAPAILRDDGLSGELEGSTIFDGISTNRAPLAATFEEISSGEQLTIAVNHFKSKGSVFPDGNNDDQNDGAGANNAIRLDASKAVADWLKTAPTGGSTDNTLLLGDFNAYAQEDPIRYLIEEESYTDLAAQFTDGTPYSFLFDGQLGTLDYAFANAALLPKITGATEWHVNADEADVLDYNTDFGRPVDLFDGSNPFRNSDHDPLIIGIDLTPEVEPETAVARVEFVEQRFRDTAVYSVDGEEVDSQSLRYLQRKIDIDAAGFTFSADDGIRFSPEFLTTAGSGVGVWSIFGDRFIGSGWTTLDDREKIDLKIGEADGLGDALGLRLEFLTARGDGQITLKFYEDRSVIDEVRLDVTDGYVEYDLEDDQTFDMVKIGLTGGLEGTITATEVTRLVDTFVDIA